MNDRPEVVEPPSPASERREWWAFVVALLMVAIASSGFAVLFRTGLHMLLWQMAAAEDIVTAFVRAPMEYRLLLPALGGLLAGAMGMFTARAPRSHGVSDVMEAVVLGRVRLSMQVTLLKSLASWVAIASGCSIGREGPLIQFGGAMGKLVSDAFHLTTRHGRTLIAAGTAAGFAAAYNTPFAAMLFVLEVVAGVVVLDTMVPALIATVIATIITRAAVGEGPIYGRRTFESSVPAETVTYLVLGILSAIVAQGFMRLLSRSEGAFRGSGLPLPWRPALGGLLAGTIAVFLPEVAGNGYEPLNALLDSRYSIGFVLVLLIGKALATAACVSSGIPGGVFTPILLVGGAVGFGFHAGLEQIGGAAIAPAGGYALVGMAAATAATTHAPLMAAVMAFELSGDYGLVLPLMLATAVAAATSKSLRKDSIYTAELRDRGVAWELTLEGRRIEGE